MSWCGIIQVCNLKPKFPITNQLAVTLSGGHSSFIQSCVASFLNSVFYRKTCSSMNTDLLSMLNENRATLVIYFELCSLWNRQPCDGFVFLHLLGCSLATSDTFGTPEPTPYRNRSASFENPDRQRKADVILGAHRLLILLWSRLFLKIDHLCCLLMPQSCKDWIFRPTNTNEEMEKQRNSCSSAPIKQRRLPVTRWLLVFNLISAICTGTSEHENSHWPQIIKKRKTLDLMECVVEPINCQNKQIEP